MKQYTEQLFQPYRCEDLFDLVLDIESYPEFVPGWQLAHIVEQGDNCLRVAQKIGLGPARLTFTSVANFERPHLIHIESTGRAFSQLRIDWRFSPRAGGCLVAFESSLQLSAMQGLAKPLLNLMGNGVIQAFKRRAASRLHVLRSTSD